MPKKVWTAQDEEERKRRRAEVEAQRAQQVAEHQALAQADEATKKAHRESVTKTGNEHYSQDVYNKVIAENRGYQAEVQRQTAGKYAPSQYKHAYENVALADLPTLARKNKPQTMVKFDGDYSRFKNENDVYNTALGIKDEDQQKRFVQGWQEYTSSTDYKNRQARTAAMNSLAGLYDVNGNAINVNTASYSQVVQGIRSIVDPTKRDAAIKNLETLTKTEGSRFYGQTIDKKVLDSYLGNPGFDQESYDSWIEGFDNAFYPQSGHEEENEEQYFSFAQEIAESGHSDRVKAQLLEQLDSVYTDSTGKAAPKQQGEVAADEEKEAQGPKQEGATEKKSFWETLDELGKPENAWDPMNPIKHDPEDEGKSWSEKIIEDTVDAEWLEEYEKKQGGAKLTGGLPGGATVVGQYASASPIVKPSQKKEGEEQEPKQYIQVKDDADVLKALYSGNFGQVAPEYQQNIIDMAKYPTVKKLFDAQTTEWDFESNLSTLGSHGHDAYALLMSEEYPEEIRYDGLLVLMQLAQEADMLDQGDKLPEPTKRGEDFETFYPESALERYLMIDESALARYNEIAGSKKAFEDDRAAQLAQQQELEKQALEQAREAVKNGNASQEQIELVLANAPDLSADFAGIKSMSLVDPTIKERFKAIESWDDGYFAYDEGHGFEKSDVYRALVTDAGLSDDMDLRFHLRDSMEALMEEDWSTARMLGMNLEEFYQSIGGMTDDQLCRRAATRLQQMGTKIEGADLEVLSVETGGDGVGLGSTVKLGVVHGVNGLYASYADSLYIGSNESVVNLTAGRMRNEYQKTYGVMGRDMYRAGLMALINSGKMPEGYAKTLQEAMKVAGDIYDIGIDPAANLGILDASKKAKDNVKLVESYMLENGTEGENYWFRQVSGATSNALRAGAAAAVTAVTGSPKIGFAVGYSAAEWDDNVNARWMQGYGREMGKVVGSLDTAGNYLANVASFESIMGRATGANSLFEKAVQKFMSGNPAGTVKALASTKAYALKLAGAKGVAALASNIIDEAVFDEAKEKITASFLNNGMIPMLKKIDEGMDIGAINVTGAIADGVLGVVKDSTGIASEIVAGFADAAIASSIFAVAGAGGAMVNAYTGTRTAQDLAAISGQEDLIQHESVQKAIDIANGNSTDIEGFIEAFQKDREDEAFVAKFNEIAKQHRIDQVTAMMIATDDDSDGVMTKVREIDEQIGSHNEQAAANKAAMDQAAVILDENNAQITAGTAGEPELTNATNAAMAIVKNKTGYDEHTREAGQKAAQRKAILDDKMAGTRLNARRQVEAEYAEMMQEFADMAPKIAQQARESELGKIQQKIDDINGQIQQEFDKGDDADFELIDSLSAQAGTLGVYLDDVTADESGEADAETIRAEAERKLEEIAENKAAYVSAETQAVLETRETTQRFEQEQSDLQGVFKKLHNDPIYVDESQAANILYETGAKNLSEFNRRFGTKLTKTDGKGTPLDGSYYAELKAMAPGYFKEAWDGHPEEAFVAMAQRQKMLKQEIVDSKDAEKRANELYRAKVSERFANINKKAEELPPGHALSQFENQNIQTSEVSTDETNELLKGTTHEVKTRETLQKAAVSRIAREGLKNTVNALMQTDRMSSEDIAAGRECLALLKKNGDILRHSMLSVKLGREATKAGQELNVFSMFQKRSAESAAADALELAAQYNRKKGRFMSANADVDAQMSIGDTQYQPFMEEHVSRSTSDPAMQKLASDINQRSGLTVYWANMPDGVRGFFDRAKGIIVLNQKIGAAQGAYIASIHEYTHFVEQSKQYEEYAKAVLKAAYGKDYETSNAMKLDEGAIRDEYAERGNELTEDLLRKELVAAATEQILLGDESFMRTLFNSGNGGVAARILAGIDSFMRKSEAKRKGKEAVAQLELLEAARAKMQDAIAKAGKWKAEANQNAQTQFSMVNPGSHYDYSKPFAEQVEDWKAGKIPAQDSLVVGKTPEVFKKIGISNLPMTMDQKHVDYAVNGTKEDHQTSNELLAHLPELLEEPIAIIESVTRPYDSVVVLVDAKINGKQTVVPITIQTESEVNGVRIDANHMASVYGKNNAVQLFENALKKEKADNVGIYYVDKNRASVLISGPGLQLPGDSNQDGLIHSIFDAGSPVNRKYLEQTETKQFKRWFGDSKVKNEDGSPKIMYRGGNEDIQVFDRKKSKASNLYGRGFYFTSEENQAAAYGEVHPYYLHIEKPLSAESGEKKIGPAQLRKFLEAVAEDEDYGLENYGYGATVESVLKSLKGKDDFSTLQDINATAIGDFVAAIELFNEVNGTNYDGIVTPTETVVFRSEQIKSADKNIGLFDPQNPNVYFSIQVERNVQGAQTQLGNQQMISDEDTYDRISAPMPDGDVAMNAEPSGQQTEMQDPDDVNVNEVARRVMENIKALEQPDVNTNNEWGLPLNQFQREMIAKYKLGNVKLPGLNYNRATKEQRMLCAVLATPVDRIGPNRQTLTEQLQDLQKGNLAVVTEADYNYILSQAAIVEGSAVDEAGVPLSREGEQAFGRMQDAKANIQPSNFSEKWSALRYINLLSSPVTTIKNIDGNALIQAADRFSTIGAEWFDKQVAKRTGTRTTASATKEERKAGTAAAMQRGRNAYDDYFVAKTSTSRSRNYNAGGDGRVFQTEAFETIRNVINFAMDAPDQMFMEKTIAEEMAVLKRIEAKIRDEETGVMRDMTEGEMYEEAYNRASERFYHDDNAMVRIMNEVYRVPWFGTLARVLVPFAKTPSNVALRMFDYSPLGLAKSILYDGLYAMNADKGDGVVGARFDQRKFVMGMSRGLTGTALTAVGMLLFNSGILSFGREEEENKKRRNVLSHLGEPYSMYINIGDTKHEIAFTMPALAGLVIGAGIAERMENKEDLWNVAVGVVSDQVNQFFDNSYLSTLNDVLSGYEEGSSKFWHMVDTTAESYMTQTFAPSALRAFAKAADPYVRDTGDSNWMRQKINEIVVQNWPVIRQTLPVKYDLTGDMMTQRKAYTVGGVWENAAMHWIDSLLSPTATYSDKDDAALVELLELSYVANDTACLPTQLIEDKDWSLSISANYAKELGFKDSKGRGKAMNIALTDDEKRMLNQEYSYVLFNGSGNTRYVNEDGRYTSVEGLREMLESREWEKADVKARVDMVEKEIKKVKLLMMKKVVDQRKKRGEL